MGDNNAPAGNDAQQGEDFMDPEDLARMIEMMTMHVGESIGDQLRAVIGLLISGADSPPDVELDNELADTAIERCRAGEVGAFALLGVNLDMCAGADAFFARADACPEVELRTLGTPGKEARVSYLVRVAPPGEG